LAVERKFVDDNIRKLQVKEYIKTELDRAGCGEIDIQRTPLGTRVMIFAQRPGIVIGRKGMSIRKLTEVLEKDYQIDNPQVEVNELGVPELNAQVMANGIASAIERGIHFRRAAYTTLRRIMEAGARGAQIRISGKLTGERSKSVKFLDGYLKHCGEPAIMYVKVGNARANPKPGVIGVQVKIMPPGVKLPDDIEFIDVEVKPEKTVRSEKIEELVEDIEEKLEKIDEGGAPVPKKIKTEKVKKKKKKPTEAEIDLPEDELEAEEAPEKKEPPKPKSKAKASPKAKPKAKKTTKKKGKKDGDTKK